MSQKLIVLKTAEEVDALIEYIADKDFISVDTETTGLDQWSEIIGLSLCAEANIGYYIITAAWSPSKQALEYYPTKERMKALCEALKAKQLVLHNAIFDCWMIANNYKVSLIDSVHTDTMILAHLLDENRRVGLKELGAHFYGASAKKEQEEMNASVIANGGQLTKKCFELYKGDADLIAKYGAKDAILTYNLFYEMVPQLYEEGLEKFFYEDESMPLLRGPTYDMNTVGLRVDTKRLADLKRQLEIEILELEAFISKEIEPHIKETYPGTNKKNIFNINSGRQIAWLLFEKLGNMFPKVSNAGQELAKALELRTPYSLSDKKFFIETVKARAGFQWREAGEVWDPKTRRYKGKAKVENYWNYLSTDKVALGAFSEKYAWVKKLLEYKKLSKLLSTYVEGIQEATNYGIVRPSFKQAGTTSGRYSSSKPNFQNLPRDDKRIKSCIIARDGNVLVGADYSQLEPRVFASFSKDWRLLNSFKSNEDFYSVIGMEVFDKKDCLPLKDGHPDAFGIKYKKLRDIAKVVALSATYGTTAPKMALAIGKSKEEAQYVIDSYFSKFPQVLDLMLESHEQAKKTGRVENLFGRPRRMPAALEIGEMYANVPHSQLHYAHRNLLNLSINHRIQSTGASIMNRAAIAFKNNCKILAESDGRWNNVKIIMQVHDELIAEGPEEIAEEIVVVLKDSMEKTVELPGVELLTEPAIGKNLAELK